MLASAIPTLKNRSGYRSAKRLVFIETEVSAPSTTILGSFAPSSRSASARASRIELIWTSISPCVPPLLKDRIIRCSSLIPHRLDQFLHSVLVRSFSMISRVPLHERDPLALYRVCYDYSRPVPHVLRFFQGFDYLTKIEPINL